MAGEKKDQIVTLCMSRRRNEIDADEFGKRLAKLLEDPGEVENIAIDVEHLYLKANP